MRRCVAGVALVLAVGACTRREAPSLPAEASAPRPVGLADPANAPALVAAAKDVLARCELTNGSFKSCEAFRAYKARKVTRADAATLVAFMEDADPKVEALGAYHAARHRDLFREDIDLATRLVVHAEGMTAVNDLHGPELAGILCRVDRAKTNLGPRISKLASTGQLGTRSARLQGGLVTCLAREYPGDGEVMALAREAERHPNRDLNRAGRFALTHRPPTADECRGWAQDLANEGDRPIKVAVEKLLDGRKQYGNGFIAGRPDGSEHNWCPPAAVDAAIDALRRWYTQGVFDQDIRVERNLVANLGYLGLAENVSAAQKAKAYALAKEISEQWKDGFEAYAVYAMALLDPAAARPIVMGLDAGYTREHAMELMDERPDP